MTEPTPSPPAPSLLDQLCIDFPGLDLFLAWMATFFQMPPKLIRSRFAQGVETLGATAAHTACGQWQDLDILPQLRARTDPQVAALWQSPLWQVLLEHVIHFAPPAGTDITEHLPPPCPDVDAFLARQIPPLETKGYWRQSLFLPLHEIYLEPYLDPALSPRGCDLACGWGRATLSLRQAHQRQMWGCDLSVENLKRFEHLAHIRGLSGSLSTVRATVFDLPFPESYFGFTLVFDILEHLTTKAIHRTLAEILRIVQPGGVVYTEIPLHDYCPPATHLQHFGANDVTELFAAASYSSSSKRFSPLAYDPRIPHARSWRVEEA